MLLEKLSQAFGVSGYEYEVRNIIKEELTPFVDSMRTDSLGNLIVFKKALHNSPKIMLTAHMDEVGLMVTSIDQSGLLKFRKIGGIDDRVLVSKKVVIGSQKIKGVIGAKAIHLQKSKERKNTINFDQLFIDIGTSSLEETQKIVKIGDYVGFDNKPKLIEDNIFMGKALDNRVGCLLLIELLKKELPVSIYGAFTVQEEIGLRGAGVVAYNIKPDLALVLETTTAADVVEYKEHLHATTIGAGPIFTIMDASFVTNKKFLDFLIRTAEKNSIPYQLRRFTGAGTDAGRISLSESGILSAVISTPCRYLHSPTSLINLQDVRWIEKLLILLLDSLVEGGLKT